MTKSPDLDRLLDYWAKGQKVPPERHEVIRERSKKMNMWPGVVLAVTGLTTMLTGPLYGQGWLTQLAACAVIGVGLLHVLVNINHNV